MPDNKELTRRFFEEVVNKGNMTVVDELIANGFVNHEEFPGIAPNKQGVRDFFTLLRIAFPDLHANIEDMIGDGDRVVVRSTMTGTHRSEFMGVPASGKSISVNVIDIVRVDGNGQATDHWGVMDAMTLMQQIGAVPGA